MKNQNQKVVTEDNARMALADGYRGCVTWRCILEVVSVANGGQSSEALWFFGADSEAINRGRLSVCVAKAREISNY